MMKHKLPKNWIAVNSKSHPDRLYYFNVKTNETTWIQPALDVTRTSSESNKDDNKKYNKDKARTLESKDTLGSETSQSSKSSYGRSSSLHKITKQSNKEIEQMKAIRAKICQKSSTRNLSQKLTKDDRSTKSSDKKSSDVTTFTPQLHLLYDRIQQKTNGSSEIDKRKKWDARKNSSKFIKPISTIQEMDKNKKDKRQENINQNKKATMGQRKERKQRKNLPERKNLAMERMQNIRKRYSTDCLNSIPEKIPRVLDKSLLNSHDNINVSQGKKVRLKRFHNRILKESTRGKNAPVKLQQKKDRDNNTDRDNKSIKIKQSKEPIADNMTKDELEEQAKREIYHEEMDWEPTNTEEIVLKVEVVRTQLSKENSKHEVDHILENANKELIQLNGLESGQSQDKQPLYIVIDTNVFLSNLDMVEQARDGANENPRPVIVIPWTVISELDYIKEHNKEELQLKARKAIVFLNKQFSSKHPRVIGQTRVDAIKNKKKFSLECPDDEILQCCLQLRELQKTVVLLSYDINLCNKALIHDIKMYNESLGKTDLNDSCTITEELSLTDDIFEDTKAIVKNFLSTIITKQMAEIYGAADWQMYVIIKPPWTVVTALKCVIKHWIAAINESFQRRADSILKELLPMFEHVSVGGRKLQDMEYILEKCSDLMQMVNVDKHSELMTQTLNAIMKLKKKCEKSIVVIDQKKLFEKIGLAENVEEQETRATKVFLCFEHIYSRARDICGLACSVAGLAYSFNCKPVDPPMSHAALAQIRPEISKKIADLTMNLNKLLVQAEGSIKYKTLLNLQQILNTFFPQTFDVEPLDIYYCIKLKEDILKNGLKQLQELSTHFCALATHI